MQVVSCIWHLATGIRHRQDYAREVKHPLLRKRAPSMSLPTWDSRLSMAQM